MEPKQKVVIPGQDPPISWYQEGYNTLRVDIGTQTVGLFYNSRDRLRHSALYKPHKLAPCITLCGRRDVNFSATGTADKPCPACMTALTQMITGQ